LRSLGLKVVVSELDIDVVTRSRWWADDGRHREELAKFDPFKDGVPPEVERRQSDQYAGLFREFERNRDLVARVTFWNLHDGESWLNYFPWRRVNHPLLFDRERRPKPAFDAVFEVLTSFASAPPGPRHPPRARTDENSRLAHEQLVAKTRQGKIDIYFQGDSITRRWGATDYPTLLAHWRKSFHGWNAANFGWGGDTTHNMLWRMQHGELDGLSPKVIVLQAGTNNLPRSGPAADSDVDGVVDGHRAMIAEFQRRFPEATIVLTALFPRPQNRELASAIERINRRLASLAVGRQIRFLNINHRLSDDSGAFRPGFSADGVHLEEPAYEIWAAALKPVFTEILGAPAAEDLAPPPTGDPAKAR
jgi:lysophospholipase L1-like esterase